MLASLQTTPLDRKKIAAARQPLREITATLAIENNAITLLQNFFPTNVVLFVMLRGPNSEDFVYSHAYWIIDKSWFY